MYYGYSGYPAFIGQDPNEGENQPTHYLWTLNQGSNTWSPQGPVNLYQLGDRLHNMPSTGIMVYLQPLPQQNV